MGVWRDNIHIIGLLSSQKVRGNGWRLVGQKDLPWYVANKCRLVKDNQFALSNDSYLIHSSLVTVFEWPIREILLTWPNEMKSQQMPSSSVKKNIRMDKDMLFIFSGAWVFLGGIITDSLLLVIGYVRVINKMTTSI